MNKVDETKEFSLIGACTICGTINAIDLIYSPENEKAMRAPDRKISKVSRTAARCMSRDLDNCNHKELVAELKREIEYLKNPTGEPFQSKKL